MRAPFAETAIFFRPAPKSSGGVAGLPHLDQTSPPRHTTDPNQRPPRNLGNHHGGTDCNDSPRLSDRVHVAQEEDDRYRWGRCLGCQRGNAAAGCGDHGHLAAHQIGRKRRQAIILIFGPPVFEIGKSNVYSRARSHQMCYRRDRMTR
jgi:hypothetical protein